MKCRHLSIFKHWLKRLIKDGDTITFLIGLQHILEEQRCRPDFINQVSNWKEQLLRRTSVAPSQKRASLTHKIKKSDSDSTGFTPLLLVKSEEANWR